MALIDSKNAVNLWGLGFVAAGLGQVVMNKQIAKQSRWGSSGWQREVIIWNAGTVTAIAALRARPDNPDRALVTGYTVLSTLFAANHIYSILREDGGGVQTHLKALGMNLGGIAIGAAVLSEQDA